MQNQFQLFRRKALRDAWIKNGIIGISAAFFAVGVILFASKRTGFPAWYALLGIVALPIGTGISFWVHRIAERKLAKQIDARFQLHEKVQTMVAFETSEDIMAKIQREDTQRRLSEIDVRKLGFRGLVGYILLPILAAALLVGAIVFPSGAETPSDDPTSDLPPIREITDWEWKALDELIAYVRDSDADDQVMKPKTLEALDDLRTLLFKGVKEDSLSMVVGVTITEVNNIEVKANQEEISDLQKERNTEVSKYTVNKLCEIFGIGLPSAPESSETDNTETPNTDQSWSGIGDVSMGANEKLFDSDQGYIAYKDVINDYYSEINKAFHEGVLSEEEWYDFLMSYFHYLYGADAD